MRIEVVSALPHSTVHQAVLSRRNRSIICAGPYEVLPLETCFEPLPSTSSLSDCAIECLELATDERTIGVATNALLKIADVQSGREIRNLTGHTSPITSLAGSEFSVYSWYTGSSDFSWSQWDTRMHPSKILGARTSGVVRSVALSPGDRFVAIGTDNSIQLFDARQRQYVKQFNCSGHRLEFNPTEVLLSSIGHDRIVRFFCLESFDLISQSDPFLDDIQASAFDSHLMIAATNDSINLLTWEPCDILTTVPLKNVDKVVNVSVNGGVELDFICIGENTERLEMRSYSIEELLSYSPSHELSGSIYEEDESDISPVEESKNFIAAESLTSKAEMDEIPSTSPSFSSSCSEANSPEASINDSSSPVESTQSSPSSPTRVVAIKTRSASQKNTRSTSVRSAKTIPTTSSSKPGSVGRSVTPVLSKLPPAKNHPATHPRSASTAPKQSQRPKQSPSMTNLLVKTSSISGSTQSLASSEKGPKKRSASTQRDSENFTITYIGRPRTPSEGEVVPVGKPKFALPTSTAISRRKASPSVSRELNKKTSPTKKTSGKNKCTSAIVEEEMDDFFDFSHKISTSYDKFQKMSSRRGNDIFMSKDLQNDDESFAIATTLITKRHEWSVNTCYTFLQTLIDNVLSTELDLQSSSLSALDAIANTMLDNLIKFSKAFSRIGVDVAAEERSEKAKDCIEKLRDMCKKRDWYYKQIDKKAVERLDAIFERLKIL